MGSANVVDYIEMRPNGDVDGNWRYSHISLNGVNIVAASSSGRIYVSNNSGSTWTEKQLVGDLDVYWSVSASSDGATVAAGYDAGKLFISTNYGVDWSEKTITGLTTGQYLPVVSLDGKHIFLSYYNEVFGTTCKLFYSSDYGNNFNEVNPTGTGYKAWGPMCINGNGTFLGVTLYEGQDAAKIYISSNSGSSWSLATSPTLLSEVWRWGSFNSDSTGNKLILTRYTDGTDGHVYLSTNMGTSWTEVYPSSPLTTSSWLFSSCSQNGHIISASDVFNQKLYISKDSGSTWSLVSTSAKAGGYSSLSVTNNSITFGEIASGRLYAGSVNNNKVIKCLIFAVETVNGSIRRWLAPII